MELPKNITQIGEVSKDCKIYVEDYVVSYMKQLNQSAQDKGMAVALYGKRKTEEGITYHFLYGACKLDSLQRDVRHLSQAQQMEVEKLRKRYFPDLNFMGYRLLNGEMIEGLHLCEQDICRYIGGYARFYEKNDAMLAYMLDVRAEAEPEYVDQTKYEEVKKRQEERREHTSSDVQPVAWLKQSMPASANLQKMRMAAVGAFALLCLMGIATFREDELAGDLQANAGDVAVSATMESLDEQKDTLMMEDKLEQALLAENQSTAHEESAEVPETESYEAESTDAESVESENSDLESAEPEGSQGSEAKQTNESREDSEQEGAFSESSSEEKDSVESEESTQTSQIGDGAVAYIIQPGDTLIGICLRQYGSDVRMADVCSINDITNPDDIKEGQVIMLPL